MRIKANVSPSLDLTLGHLPSQDETLTDTTVVAFHPYVAKALRTRTGGSGGSGDNGGKQKWWLGVALGATLGATLAQTQQQVIESPQVEEIPDISIGQEFDVEYGTYIETDTNTGAEEEKDYILLTPTPGSSPGTGMDPGTDPSDPSTETKTLKDIWDSIVKLPGQIANAFNPPPPSDHNQFALIDLSKYFPFCIPFDLYKFFQLLNAEPVAPVLSWEIRDLAGQTYSLDVDLAQWDPVALLFRRLQLFLFITGLAAASRKFIKW